MVCERWGVTKCVKLLYVKFVCVCVKLLYVKFVCEVMVCERWGVTKLCMCECV